MNSNISSGIALASSSKKGSQLRALFLKNGLLQSKQPCTNICQILTPVMCLFFTYVIRRLVSQNLPSSALFQDSPYPYTFGNYTVFDSYSRSASIFGKLTATSSRTVPLQWYLFNCESNCDAKLLGSNDGSRPVTISDNQTLLGSIINAPPTTNVTNFTLDIYTNPNKD